MNIGRYLRHRVIIVRITLTKGVRTEVPETDVVSFITHRKAIVRDVRGDIPQNRTVVYLLGNTVLDEGDEIIVDGRQRPIEQITLVRGKTSVIHHLEVELS